MLYGRRWYPCVVEMMMMMMVVEEEHRYSEERTCYSYNSRTEINLNISVRGSTAYSPLSYGIHSLIFGICLSVVLKNFQVIDVNYLRDACRVYDRGWT